ncbi:hypothetical protein CMV_003426 [Castanea mollissima]|uniref:Apple domain-containing protein n=1 Tax=Castanea mollissima TaxID=60419 RepID=A0A8J4RNX3_9ROSI|nr:hypothetical protein CMV_003426 [Castanea mollissima]
MDYKKNPWPMMLSFLFICLSLNNHPSLGVDTISADQPLSGDQTIISNGWNFELGFFTPDSAAFMVGKYQAVEFTLVSTKDTICLKGFQATSSNNWNLSDFSAGCARKTSLQCGNDSLANGKRDEFWEMPNMKLPDHPQTVAVGNSSECESTYLNNCSCTAYAYGHHCSIWIGDLLNLQQLTSSDTNGGTLYLKLAASELSSKAITIAMVLV